MDIPQPELLFRTLKPGELLPARQMRTLSRLIYEAEPRVYSALFHSEAEAEALLPELIRLGDPVFRTERCFVAVRGMDLLGLILFCRGSVSWSPMAYRAALARWELPVSDGLEAVERGFFVRYQTTAENAVSLIHLCVRPEARGQGLGKRLLNAFLTEQVGAAPAELFVPADNAAAIRLCESAGFAAADAGEADFLSPEYGLCRRMVREAKL